MTRCLGARFSSALAVVFILSVARAASAFEHDSSGWTTDVDLGGALSPRARGVSVAQGSLGLRVERRTPSGWIGLADFAGTLTHLETDARGASWAVHPGNLLLGGAYAFAANELALRIGATVAAPLAIYWDSTIDGNRRADLAMTSAASARGWRDPFRWTQNAASIFADVQVTWRPMAWLETHARLSPGAIVSVNRLPSAFGWSSTAEIEAKLGVVRPHASWSYFLTTRGLENNDVDAHSVGFGSRVDVALRHSFDATVYLNLDAPFGLDASGPKTTWGVVVAWQANW